MTFFIVWTEYNEELAGIYQDRMKAIEHCREEWKRYTGSLDPSLYASVTENEFEDDGPKPGRYLAFTKDKP